MPLLLPCPQAPPALVTGSEDDNSQADDESEGDDGSFVDSDDEYDTAQSAAQKGRGADATASGFTPGVLRHGSPPKLTGGFPTLLQRLGCMQTPCRLGVWRCDTLEV